LAKIVAVSSVSASPLKEVVEVLPLIETIPREVVDVPPLAVIAKEPAELAAIAVGTATTDNKPAPSVETATSAMRLRSVFIDIYFLSLSQTRPFLIWLEGVFGSF